MQARQISLRHLALAVTGVVLVLLLLARFHVIRVPHGWVFALIILLAVVSNFTWWAWGDHWLKRGQVPEPGGRSRRWPRRAWGAFILLMMSPLILFLLRFGELWDRMPISVIMWNIIWHMTLMVVGTVMVGSVVVWLTVWAARRAARRPTVADAVGESAVNLSRRALLTRAAMAAPIVVTASAVAGGHMQAGRFRVRRLTMTMPRLPERLRGLTITQVSDLHVGRLFRPEHLPALVDAANGLKSDLVAVTGDIVNHTNETLPAACDALAQLEHRYGRFVVVGNHDLIDEPRELLTYLGEREPGVLHDRHVTLDIGGEKIQVAGLFWSISEQQIGTDPGYALRAATALVGAPPDRFTLALTHHPHAFDALADRGVDLTLAGHTHGGQVMLTPPGAARPIGGGCLLFRYIWGEYRRGNSAMYVNSGVGNWFPIRINAPAEIVQIQLI